MPEKGCAAVAAASLGANTHPSPRPHVPILISGHPAAPAIPLADAGGAIAQKMDADASI
jgi:hypothetical protein